MTGYYVAQFFLPLRRAFNTL